MLYYMMSYYIMLCCISPPARPGSRRACRRACRRCRWVPTHLAALLQIEDQGFTGSGCMAAAQTSYLRSLDTSLSNPPKSRTFFAETLEGN